MDNHTVSEETTPDTTEAPIVEESEGAQATPPKRPRGRPKMVHSDKTVQVNVVVTEEIANRLKEKAKELGIVRSQFIRNMFEDALK